MPYEVIALDRETALESMANIRKIVLTSDVGELDGWPRIPIQIDDLDQLSDVLDMWGVRNRPCQLDVERAVDRHAVWIGRGVAVRCVKGVKHIRRAATD
jgi:hypothetical protein